MTHPRKRLDEVIHSPVRLSIMAALAGVDRAEFRAVRDTIQISDSALSKQITLLEDAGYLDVSKGRVGRYPRTWLAITHTGRDALDHHLAALEAITRLARTPTPDQAAPEPPLPRKEHAR